MSYRARSFQTLSFDGESLVLLDQLRLPTETVYHRYTDVEGVAQAIAEMVVRGAPAIGIAAAYGFVLGSREWSQLPSSAEVEGLRSILLNARPTAVNLAWAVDRMTQAVVDCANFDMLDATLVALAIEIHRDDEHMCSLIGRHGADHLVGAQRILTHCNTGALATGGDGTALAIIRELHRRRGLIEVFVDETRPYLQGSRLTAWELVEDQIPCTLIADNMASFVMKSRQIDAVIVGADRIASNGDVANKIGTYNLAISCAYHKIPFVVAAPTSTFDLDSKTGNDIVIEERPADELRKIHERYIAPQSVNVFNPAFDVTPAALIDAIVTEHGVVKRGAFMTLREHLERNASVS